VIKTDGASSTSALRKIAALIACVLIVLSVFAAATAPPLLPRLFFFRQDLLVLAVLVGLLIIAAGSGWRTVWPRPPELAFSRRTVLIGALGLALALWAGTYVLLGNYPLTGDESMVVFDMHIFRSWQLAAPVPPEWRMFVKAIAPEFLLSLPGNAAWVSSYMPTNAMLRAAFGTVLDPALMNPLLAAAGAVALFDIAGRIFPGRRSAQAIALLLYATSAQLLVTAMMPYAMTAHLSLNLIWLMLYLRGTRASHAAAIAIGFVAIGLHQVVFHPLFALPFIDHLRRQGQWRTAVVYLGCYALFGLFWMSYPHLVAWSAGLTSATGVSSGTSGFIAQRVLPLLLHHEPTTIPLMVVNLLRFVTWENLALLPLMALGYGAMRRNEGIARPLAYGIALTFLAMAFLLPYQGHGWGYRYLHGLIGNCALLAAYGWRDFSDRDEVRSFVGVATGVTIFATVPFLLWTTHAFARPYVRVNRMIDGIHADMAIIESSGPEFRIDEVRNNPDLSNRPLRLASTALKPADIPVLCTRGTIAFVDAEEMRALGLGDRRDPGSARFELLRRAAQHYCPRSDPAVAAKLAADRHGKE
jgi:hypothetical protein